MGGVAEDFTEDLWFKPFPEPSTAYADVVVAAFSLPFGIPVYVLFVAGLSYMAGGLAGLLITGEWRPFARVALWNVLTLGAVAIAVKRAKCPHGVPLRLWRVEFLVFFSILFLILTAVAQWLLRLPLPS